MIKYIKRKIMAFGDLFKDKNDINEKSIVGFISLKLLDITRKKSKTNLDD